MSRSLPLFLTLWLGLVPQARGEELSLRWGGKIQTDVRFRPAAKGMGRYFQYLEAPAGVSRNENIFKLKLDAEIGPVVGVAELDFVYYGFAHELDGIGDLTLREDVDPYRIEAHALYVAVTDFPISGLDIRVGQQLVLWGKGDQFNPTNTINANDIEDPLLFGEQLANLMLKVDYTVKEVWTFSGVLVPLFKPAILPPTAPLGTAAAERMPMTSASLRRRMLIEKAFTDQALAYPTIVKRVIPDLPETSADNMQWALRVAGTLAEQDLALSYYFGRTDMPQPYLNLTRQNSTGQCNPDDPKDCINGLLETEVHLGYPRVQVLGFNAAGQFDAFGWLTSKIKPIGYRIELGVFFPQEASLILLQEKLDFSGLVTLPGGEYDYNLGLPGKLPRPLVVEDTPFLKWTVGLDYTFNKYVYLNVQWVHGMADEFGAGDFISEGWSVRGASAADLTPALPCLADRDPQACLAKISEKLIRETLRPRIGDYLVLGVDIKLFSERMLIRLFSIWDLTGVYEESWDNQAQRRVRRHRSMFTSEGFSAVIYPEVQYNVGHGLDFGAGALIMLGEDQTKFGDPATGGTQIFTRARFQF